MNQVKTTGRLLLLTYLKETAQVRWRTHITGFILNMTRKIFLKTTR